MYLECYIGILHIDITFETDQVHIGTKFSVPSVGYSGGLGLLDVPNTSKGNLASAVNSCRVYRTPSEHHLPAKGIGPDQNHNITF